MDGRIKALGDANPKEGERGHGADEEDEGHKSQGLPLLSPQRGFLHNLPAARRELVHSRKF
jgi:hypothetical protein